MISGRDSSGQRHRKLLDARDRRQAERLGREFLFGEERAFLADNADVTIIDAIARCIHGVCGTDETKTGLTLRGGYFIRWCQSKGLAFWRQVDYAAIEGYANALLHGDRTTGFKSHEPKTVQNYLEVVRRTSRWMARQFRGHFHDEARDYQVSARHQKKKPKLWLRIGRVVDFLEWLNDYPWRDHIIAGVALQGLCGMRLREAWRLTWRSVNLDRGLVSVQEEPEGLPKNKDSYRTIPLPALVWDLLREARNQAGNITRETRVIPSGPEGGEGHRPYARLVRNALLKWGSKLPTNDLRNTLMSEAKRRGWNQTFVRMYVGHAGTDMAELHYLGTQEDAPALGGNGFEETLNGQFTDTELLAVMQREVADKINELVAENGSKWQQSEKVVKLCRNVA